MTTENGLERAAAARRKIEALRERHDFLVQRIQEREAEGLGATNGFYRSERAALEWAIPILETEWDSLVRMRHELDLGVEVDMIDH